MGVFDRAWISGISAAKAVRSRFGVRGPQCPEILAATSSHSLPVSRQDVLKQCLGRRQQPLRDAQCVRAGRPAPRPPVPLSSPSSTAQPVRPAHRGLSGSPAASGGGSVVRAPTEHVAPVTQTAAVEVDFVLVEGWPQHVGQRQEHPVFPLVSSVPPLASSRSSGRAAPSSRSM